MKVLDRITDRAAGRRNARLNDRIAQAAERYPEPGDWRDWYQVTLNADPELTTARKDSAFWREQMLRDAPGSEARETHYWDMKEAEDALRNIEADHARELDAALAYDAREDDALQDAIEAGERFPDKIGSERDWLIVPGHERDASQLHRIAQAREELIAEGDRVERLSLRSQLKEEEWELDERREHRYSPYDEKGPETGPEPGTREWQIETGNYIDPEPDWAWDPAVNPVDGTKYYNSGRVVAADGTEISPAYTAEQWAALRNPGRAEEMSAAEFDELFPPYPKRGDWDAGHPSQFIGPPAADAVGAPEPDKYPEDYYTQPVGSDRHRAAYISHWEARGGPDFGKTLDDEYNADHYAELQQEHYQAQLDAADRERWTGDPGVAWADEEGPEPADWPETDLADVTREDAERDAAEADQRDRDAVKAYDAEQQDARPKAEAEQAQRLP